MRFVHRHGTEPPLKRMARLATSRIDEAHVTPMRLTYSLGQARDRLRQQNQVNMIRQQAIRGSLYGSTRRLQPASSGTKRNPRP